MDVEALGILIEVAKGGSISAVARASGRSRSTLRRRLDELESAVGVALLVYESRGVRLTHAGQTLAREGPALLDSIQQLRDRLTGAPTATYMRLRIVHPVGLPAVSRHVILQVIWAALPELSLEIREVESPLAHLNDPFDLMVYFGRPPLSGQGYGRLMMRHDIGLVASPEFLAKHGVPADLSAVAQHPVLVWRPALDAMAGVDLSWLPQPKLTSNDQLLLRAAAARGEGLLLGITGAVPDDPGIGRLVDVLPEAFDAVIETRSLTPLPSRMEPGAAALLDRMQAALDAVFVVR
ncbi:HTH-type transcriptional regulator DmlR [Enhygromyxa salina]|uniref:HTH-type transcriptional regulator DmlR n=1 Tax=Enhygromyxa salina TaxID=215803 RepID=A0A2S9YCL2_9BACT|nr:LysR family transcriptional regulator [Enhygromyxa salina]PRQ02823.1 HTH-type transcriptional regulator DmlR [Enhygromyxa salina]